jgi:hypothetical protein
MEVLAGAVAIQAQQAALAPADKEMMVAEVRVEPPALAAVVEPAQ